MKKGIGLALTVLCLWVAAWAADPPPAKTPHIFILQCDSQQMMGDLGFDKAFRDLLRRLPPDDAVLVFGFNLNNVYPVLLGKAGELHWPPKGFKFSSANTNTTPFKDILAILVSWRIRNCTVYVITSGRDRDLSGNMKVEGANDFLHSSLRPDMYSSSIRPLVLDGRDFDPSKYRPLSDILRYVKEQNVKVQSVFLWKNTQRDLFQKDDYTGSSFFPGDMRYVNREDTGSTLLLDSLGYTALVLIAHTSGGEVYSDFGNFGGLFGKLFP